MLRPGLGLFNLNPAMTHSLVSTSLVFYFFREDAQIRIFANKTDDVFTNVEFSFKTTEDDGRSVESTILHRQIGYVTLISETIRGTFEIVDGDAFAVFDIDRDTGLISTQKAVDRERQSEYKIKVVVAVLGSKTFSDCVVKIEVDDVNDVVPTFAADEPKVIFVSGDSAIGQPLHRVQVEDADIGNNGEISFKIEDKSGYFAIDLNEGNNHVITLTRNHLIFERFSENFFLTYNI